MGQAARLKRERELGRRIAETFDRERFVEAHKRLQAWAPARIYPVAVGRPNNPETRELVRQRAIEVLRDSGFSEVDVVVDPATLALGVRPDRAAVAQAAVRLATGAR